MKTLTMPTVLSFDRKLEPSDAIMRSGNWDDIGKADKWNKIELFDRRNRAVFSNFTQDELNDEDVLKEKMAKPNLSWGDDASLPFDENTLQVSFTLRVLGGLDTPSACNKEEYQKKYSGLVDSYISEYGLDELASRYAYNIVNGRFLWRNRVGAQEITVHVKHNSLPKSLEFNAYDYSLKDTKSSDVAINQLTDLIKNGLSNEQNILVEVNAYVKIGNGQRIWPSQEMVLNIPKGEKSRHLFSLDGSVAMHCEKIGNALRTIDDWQTVSDSPIAIEAFGSVTKRGIACRSNRDDFKSLITNWINDKEISTESKHFVIAMIVRGGVFSESDN